MSVLPSIFQKHLGIIPDNQLKFDDHLKMVSGKISETIGFLLKLQSFFTKTAVITIYKTFIKPHLNYGDIPYDHAYNMFFQQRLESSQYNAQLAITGAIRDTSKEKFC